MFKADRQNPWPPMMDLGFLRRNLGPIRDSLAQVPALAKAAAAMEAVMAELDAAERAANASRLHANLTHVRLSRLTRRH